MALRSIEARISRLEKEIWLAPHTKEINRLKAENSRLKAELESVKQIRPDNIQIKINHVKDSPDLNKLIKDVVRKGFKKWKLSEKMVKGEDGYYSSEGFRTVKEILQMSISDLQMIEQFGKKSFEYLKEDLLAAGYGQYVNEEHWLNQNGSFN